MSADIRTQQRWLIAAVVILIVLLVAVIVALIRSLPNREEAPHLGGRSPAAELAYCGPGDTGLCIVSFGQIEGGDMLVNIQIPRPSYPAFTLVINRYGVESTYECKRVKGLSTGVTCTGVLQVPGEVLQFKIISTNRGTLLAEGKFVIIGIAISTPEGLATETPEGGAEATETPFEFPTEMPTSQFPTPTLITGTPGTPTATVTVPSYPNPTIYP
jgi:hypothetical protein